MDESLAVDRVLFVDDDENVLKSIERGLVDEKFSKYFARSAKVALEKLAELDEVTVIVTDMRMPEMDGIELLRLVQEKYPDTVRIILTGYSHVYTILSAVNTGHIYRYLTKPWKMDTEFIPTIRQAIAYHHLLKERRTLVEKLTRQNERLEKQNQEINVLLSRLEESDREKSKIISHLTQEVLPYIRDTVNVSSSIPKTADNSLAEVMERLNQKGREIIDLLQRIESLMENLSRQ